MIVSHWPVASGPTVELMTLMAAAYRAAPEAGPAAALRTAMRRMREKDIAGHVGHPFIWAPFTVYGHR